MQDVLAGRPTTISAPHSGLNTTSYTFKIGSLAIGARTPADLAGGVISFTWPPGLSVGQRVLSIDATGPGGTVTVSDTVNAITPPPAPPADFSGGISVMTA